MTYTPGPTVTMLPPEHWSGRPSEQVSTSQPRSPTPRNWSDTMKDASSLPRGPMYLLTRFKLFRHPGLSPAGASMIGPFKLAPGNFKFVFVLIDKFSKWIEYMPLVKATFEKAVEFLNQIIHRFGIPNSIITDLGTQFTSTTFWDFCDDRGIVIKYMLVAHPRANGQVSARTK